MHSAPRRDVPQIIATVREMTEDERIALELELDEKHKPFTAYERSKGIVQRAAEFVAGAEANSTDSVELRTGPKSPYGVPKAEVAKAIGVGASTLRDAEQHVEAVEEFPDLAPVPQKTALREAKKRRATDDERRVPFGRHATGGSETTQQSDRQENQRIIHPKRPQQKKKGKNSGRRDSAERHVL